MTSMTRYEIKDCDVVLARVWSFRRALRFINEYWVTFGVTLKMEVVK